MLALFKAYDILYFLDTIILCTLYKVNVKKMGIVKPKRRTVAMVFLAGIAIFSANLALAEADRPQLLSRTFDRNLYCEIFRSL